jgi:hypothetical protein
MSLLVAGFAQFPLSFSRRRSVSSRVAMAKLLYPSILFHTNFKQRKTKKLQKAGVAK